MRALPLIVYKYRDWDNAFHRNTLLYNELYLASPKDFNDPFDCRISPNFKLLTEEDENQYIIDLGISGYQTSIDKNRDLVALLERFKSRLKDKKKAQNEYDLLFYENLDSHYGIVSFSTRWNSILMWSHYANSHKGFCIGYWFNKLWKSNIFGKFGNVDYKRDFPKIKPSAPKNNDIMVKNSFISTYTKSEEWDYEDEFRFAKSFFPEVPLPHERLINIPDDYIAEVTLGINMSESHRNEIKAICQSKRFPLFEAKKAEYKFEIERIQK